MNKLLRFFPLNKRVKKKDAKSLLITLGLYLAIFIALIIVRKILVSVVVIGTLVYNLSNVYIWYALAGAVLGIIKFLTDVNDEEVNYITANDIKNLYKSEKKKLAWIVTAIVVVAATLITPTGLKKERLKRAVDKYIAEDHSEESSKKEKKKEKKEEKVEEEPEEIEEVEEVVVEEEPEFEGPLYERFVPGKELGSYHDDETGTNFVIYDNGAVYTGGGKNSVIRIPAYLSFGDDKYEVKAIADMTEESTWLTEVYIPNTVTTIGYSCFSNCDDLKKVHMGNSVTYIGEFSFSDSPVGEVHLPKSVYEIGEGAFGKYNKNYARVRVSSEEQANHLRAQWPDYLQVAVDEDLELDEIEDTEITVYEKLFESTEADELEQKEQNFVIDESVVLAESVESYEGTYYKNGAGNVSLKSVTEDEIVIDEENNHYQYLGHLRRMKGYPEGVAAYEGYIDADGEMGFNDYRGELVIVLLPDDEIYVKITSGDEIYQQGFHSKDKEKYK